MSILTALAGPLIGAFFTAIFGFLTQVMVRNQAQALGVEQEANRVTSQSLQTQTAIAQAEANAPSSQSGVVSSLQAGSF